MNDVESVVEHFDVIRQISEHAVVIREGRKYPEVEAEFNEQNKEQDVGQRKITLENNFHAEHIQDAIDGENSDDDEDEMERVAKSYARRFKNGDKEPQHKYCYPGHNHLIGSAVRIVGSPSGVSVIENENCIMNAIGKNNADQRGAYYHDATSKNAEDAVGKGTLIKCADECQRRRENHR